MKDVWFVFKAFLSIIGFCLGLFAVGVLIKGDTVEGLIMLAVGIFLYFISNHLPGGKIR